MLVLTSLCVWLPYFRSAHKWSLNLTDEIKREIAIMKRLRHPNVVSLFEVIDDPTAKQVYLIQVRFLVFFIQVST